MISESLIKLLLDNNSSSNLLGFWTHFHQDTFIVDYIRSYNPVLVLCMAHSWCSLAVGLKKHEQPTGTFQIVLTVQPSKLIIEQSLPNAVDMCIVWKGCSKIQLFQESNSVRKLPAIEVVGLTQVTGMSWQSVGEQKNQILMKDEFVRAQPWYFL